MKVQTTVYSPFFFQNLTKQFHPKGSLSASDHCGSFLFFFLSVLFLFSEILHLFARHGDVLGKGLLLFALAGSSRSIAGSGSVVSTI